MKLYDLNSFNSDKILLAPIYGIYITIFLVIFAIYLAEWLKKKL